MQDANRWAQPGQTLRENWSGGKTPRRLPGGVSYSDLRLYSATNLLNPVWELVPLPQGKTVDLPTSKRQEFFRMQGR